MPGPGLVAVHFVDGYLRAPERDDEFGIKEVFIPTIPLPTMNYTAIARIDPAKGVESVKRDVTLDPGWTFTGTVLGPDGKPLAGAWGIGLTSPGLRMGSPRGDEDSRVHGAAGSTRIGRGTFSSSIRRRGWSEWPSLRRTRATRSPCNCGPAPRSRAGWSMRTGEPRPGVELVIWRRHKELAQPERISLISPQRIKTDQQGRFRIEGLLPGYEFALSDGKGSLGPRRRTPLGPDEGPG